MYKGLVLALALLAGAHAKPPGPRPRHQAGWTVDGPSLDVESEWAKFQAKFHVTYSSPAEAAKRRAIFEVSMARAVERNGQNVAAGGKNVFGVTKFSDRTQDEFDLTNKGRQGRGHLAHGFEHMNAPAPPAEELAGDGKTLAIDWTQLGYTTPVKNQGQCGSCWANSATEQIESQWMLAGFSAWELSVQQVTSCTADTFGCGGGDTTAAYEQIILGATKEGEQTFGVASAAMVPYEQSMYESCVGPVCTQDCNAQGVGNLTEMGAYEALTGYYVSISGYSYATPACSGDCANQDLSTLNANVASVGPASICVNAGAWNDYVGGVMTTAACGSYAYGDLDHCVQLTGFDLSVNEPYYMVRNSWATNWGEDGYILLSAEGNTCGLADEATFVDIVVPT